MESGEEWQLTERVWAGARSGKGNPFAAAVRATRMAMIITDPNRLDNPIVYANDAFLRLTGYARLEVTGRNCRFLQGPDTDLDAVARIRAAIKAERDVQVEVLNYRKDGSTFHNAVYISPVHDEDGTLLFFFASQFDVSERHALAEERDRTRAALETNALLLREIGHRARNDLQMISAMLALQSSNAADPAVRAALSSAMGRVEALGALYREADRPEESAEQAGQGSAYDLGQLARTVAEALIEASGRHDIAVDVDLVPLRLLPKAAAPLALILNELVTNVLKYALSSSGGRLSLRLVRDGDAVLLTVEDDGVGEEAGTSRDGSFEATLVDALCRQIGGTRERRSGPSGTTVMLRFPAKRIEA